MTRPGYHVRGRQILVEGAAPRDVERFSWQHEGKQTTINRAVDEWSIYRMWRDGRLEDREYFAAQWFRDEFDRLGVGASGAAVNPDRITVDGARRSEFTPHWLDRMDALNAALAAVGKEAGSVIWFCCGYGHSIAEWTRRMRASGVPANEHYGRGLLRGGLAALALHRGL